MKTIHERKGKNKDKKKERGDRKIIVQEGGLNDFPVRLG